MVLISKRKKRLQKIKGEKKELRFPPEYVLLKMIIVLEKSSLGQSESLICVEDHCVKILEGSVN